MDTLIFEACCVPLHEINTQRLLPCQIVYSQSTFRPKLMWPQWSLQSISSP
jgi:hypothetical protein